MVGLRAARPLQIVDVPAKMVSSASGSWVQPFDNDEGETIRSSRLEWTGPRPDIDRFNVLSASESEITPEQSEVLVILAEDGPLAPAEVHARRKGAKGRSDSATRHLLGKLRERGLVWADDQHRYNVQEGTNVRLF